MKRLVTEASCLPMMAVVPHPVLWHWVALKNARRMPLIDCPPAAPPLDTPAVPIGRITADAGIFLARSGVQEPLLARGWEHAL